MTTTDPSSGSSAPRDTLMTTGEARASPQPAEARAGFSCDATVTKHATVQAHADADVFGNAKVVVSSAHAIARAVFPDQIEGINALVEQFAAHSDPHLIAVKADPTLYLQNTNLSEVVVGALAQDELDRREKKRLAEEAERARRWSRNDGILLALVALLSSIVTIVLQALFSWLVTE
jgi:hypothetical protein